MEASILTSTKQVLGLDENYTPFDQDIIMHINSTFSIIAQLGVGPSDGFMIEDAEADWDDFDVPPIQLNLVKTYVLLKVKSLFDPPTTGYLVTQTKEQIQEYEVRLNTMAEAPGEVEV